MISTDRFQLLMRSVYEIGPELDAYKPSIPELRIVEEFAIFREVNEQRKISRHLFFLSP